MSLHGHLEQLAMQYPYWLWLLGAAIAVSLHMPLLTCTANARLGGLPNHSPACACSRLHSYIGNQDVDINQQRLAAYHILAAQA